MFTSRSRSCRYSGMHRSISAWRRVSSSGAAGGGFVVIAVESNDRYTRPAVRLIEIRLLEGPNIYRLEPAVKLEVAVGRRRSWYGQRSPGRHAVVRLSQPVPRASAPPPLRDIAAWVERLHRDTGAAEWLRAEGRSPRNGRRPRIPVAV